jgi:sugar phosphate isomerase/epimerase
MIPGYHTAGLLLHDLGAAVDELAHMGYFCVAVRPHGGSLNPGLPGFSQQMLRVADAIAKAELRLVLDLDAPFLHDPCCRRGPSLVSAEEGQCEAAAQWIRQWIQIASEIGCRLITFSSGMADQSGIDPDEQILERLAGQLGGLCERAREASVRLALHPRSGDAIATVAQFERLGQWLTDDDLFLAADIGEMLMGGELPLADRLARNLDSLACVYLCDRRAGHVGDQRIGSGDVSLRRIVRALCEHQFAGPAIVRVEGHCELGFTPAREAIPLFDSDDSA